MWVVAFTACVVFLFFLIFPFVNNTQATTDKTKQQQKLQNA
jgi:hypothetical protein